MILTALESAAAYGMHTPKMAGRAYERGGRRRSAVKVGHRRSPRRMAERFSELESFSLSGRRRKPQ